MAAHIDRLAAKPFGEVSRQLAAESSPRVAALLTLYVMLEASPDRLDTFARFRALANQPGVSAELKANIHWLASWCDTQLQSA